jgi:hypothetical protein
VRRQILRQVKRLGGNKVVLEGEEIVIPAGAGQWFIVKRPAQGATRSGPGTPAKTEAPAPEADDVL